MTPTPIQSVLPFSSGHYRPLIQELFHTNKKLRAHLNRSTWNLVAVCHRVDVR